MGRHFRARPQHGKTKQEVRVCKFQSALLTNAPGDDVQVLVYDKSREWMGEFGMPKKAAKQLFGSRLKFYATAWKDKEGRVHIEKFLPDQDW